MNYNLNDDGRLITITSDYLSRTFSEDDSQRMRNDNDFQTQVINDFLNDSQRFLETGRI